MCDPITVGVIIGVATQLHQDEQERKAISQHNDSVEEAYAVEIKNQQQAYAVSDMNSKLEMSDSRDDLVRERLQLEKEHLAETSKFVNSQASLGIEGNNTLRTMGSISIAQSEGLGANDESLGRAVGSRHVDMVTNSLNFEQGVNNSYMNAENNMLSQKSLLDRGIGITTSAIGGASMGADAGKNFKGMQSTQATPAPKNKTGGTV